jgi:hypothetical protein
MSGQIEEEESVPVLEYGKKETNKENTNEGKIKYNAHEKTEGSVEAK